MLDLRSNNISSPIPGSFANFPNLRDLDLSWNPISDPIPGFFANFSKLTFLSISGCQLNGTFPKEIFQRRLEDGILKPSHLRISGIGSSTIDEFLRLTRVPNSVAVEEEGEGTEHVQSDNSKVSCDACGVITMAFDSGRGDWADLGLTQMTIHGRKAGRLEHSRRLATGAMESTATQSQFHGQE
ncbi:hypothetical protein ACE6H2_026457 [Prunus campanulata]